MGSTLHIRVPDDAGMTRFRSAVFESGEEHRRSMPWRRTTDPYAVLVSEVMLQQTQVSRVLPKYEEFLEAFPAFEPLDAAPLAAVLRRWQGLGYNRRAMNLKRLAEIVVVQNGGALPREPSALAALPGLGAATSCAVATYAFGAFAPFIETNVRATFLHHFFADARDVPDSALRPLVEAAWDREDPRRWAWALMDHGAWLKSEGENPSRRSRHHVRQSPFEGSRRQRRSRVLRAVLALPGQSVDDYAVELQLEAAEVDELLEELAREGFLSREDDRYSVGD